METTITQYKLFTSFEKEETWLSNMSTQGWHLSGVSALGLEYKFVKGEPEQRIYKIDFRRFKRAAEMDEYLTLFEDSGWTCINPRLSAYNYFFYSQADGAGKDIFSDSASKAQRIRRYTNYIWLSLFISTIPYLGLYLSGAFKLSEVGYQTPGIWQMQGSEFISHLLFETPFVILRVASGLFPVFLLLLGLIFTLYYNRQYKKVLAG